MVCIVLIVCIGFWKTLDSLDCLYCFLDWVGLFGVVRLWIWFGLLDSLDCVYYFLDVCWIVLIVWIGSTLLGQSFLFILLLGLVWAV